jgi:hypothetical protein
LWTGFRGSVFPTLFLFFRALCIPPLFPAFFFP